MHSIPAEPRQSTRRSGPQQLFLLVMDALVVMTRCDSLIVENGFSSRNCILVLAFVKRARIQKQFHEVFKAFKNQQFWNWVQGLSSAPRFAVRRSVPNFQKSSKFANSGSDPLINF
jgi:hypothetical protein